MTVLSVYATVDTTISQQNPTTNGNDWPVGTVGRESNGDYSYVLMKFDISSIPAGAIISSVTLYVYVTSIYGSQSPGRKFYVTNASSPWVETITWNTRPSLNDNRDEYIPVANQVNAIDMTSLFVSSQASIASYGLCLYGGADDAHFQCNLEPSSNPMYMRIEYSPSNSAPTAPTVWLGQSSPNNSSVCQVNWTHNDPEGSNTQRAYHVVGSYDNFATWHTNTGITLLSGSGGSVTVDTSQSDGNWQFAVMTWDHENVQSPWAYSSPILYDRTPPSIASITGYTATKTAIQRMYIYGVSDSGSGIQGVHAYILNLDGATWLGPYLATNAGGGTWYYDFNADYQGNGAHTVRFWVYDGANNANHLDSTIYYDTTPAVVTGVSPVQYTSGNNTRVWAYGVTDAQTGINYIGVDVYNPSGSMVAQDVHMTKNGATNDWYYDYPSLNVDGQWHFAFYVRDNAGNLTAATCDTVRDTSVPIIGSGDGDRFSNQTSGTIRHTVSNVSDQTSGINRATFQYRKSVDNGATWGAWGDVYDATQNGTSWYHDMVSSGDGYYEVAVMAYDKANNASSYYYMHTTVDSVRANDPNVQVVYGTTSATFTWDAFSDPNPTSGRKYTEFYLYEWDGTTMGIVHHSGDDIGNVTTYTQPGLKEGQRYRYTVAYRDNSGNESGYTYKEFITKKRVGTRKIRGDDENIILPVYSVESGVLGSKAYRIACTDGVVGCYELVDITDLNASPERIHTSQGLKAIAKL